MKNQVKAIEMELSAMKPILRLSSEDLEEIEEWEVGKKYDILCSVTMTGKHARGKEMSGEFEVESCEAE